MDDNITKAEEKILKGIKVKGLPNKYSMYGNEMDWTSYDNGEKYVGIGIHKVVNGDTITWGQYYKDDDDTGMSYLNTEKEWETDKDNDIKLLKKIVSFVNKEYKRGLDVNDIG